MARKKTPKDQVDVKASLSRRLREIRHEIFGEHGGPELARRLSLPARTWYNYEIGVTVPAEVLIAFLEQTDVNPAWLLSGHGPKYRRSFDDHLNSELTPLELIRCALERLERASSEVVNVACENLPGEVASEFVAVGVYPITEIHRTVPDPARVEGHVPARRQWLRNPTAMIGTRVIDDAMHPAVPSGSIVGIDRSLTDPWKLDGQMVAACHDGVPMIRWLEKHGGHIILRPNRESKAFTPILFASEKQNPQPIIGQVVWSWSRFG